jgi:hypothetical protein
MWPLYTWAYAIGSNIYAQERPCAYYFDGKIAIIDSIKKIAIIVGYERQRFKFHYRVY